MLRMTMAGLTLLGALGMAGGAGTRAAAAAPANEKPRIDPAKFRAVVDNPWLPMVPGTTFRFVEKLGKNTSDIEVAVTHETRKVMEVSCVVVRERVAVKGKAESLNETWYAQDADGNVWIFGEADQEFLDRGRVSTEGSWEAGVDGAEPGIVMHANPAPGKPYAQGLAPGIAEDMEQVVSVTDSVTVPYGTFAGCVRTKQWSMLETGTDKKWYAKGVGLVRALSAAREETVLISVSRP